MTEGQVHRLLSRLADGICETDAYRYAGVPLDSQGECNLAVNRRLGREARFRHRYTDAYYRGAQRRADREHPAPY